MKTYTYKTVGELKIEADVWRPEGAAVRPVLIWLHGGALIMGGRRSPGDAPPDLLGLCQQEGYVLVSADYRLAPEAKPV